MRVECATRANTTLPVHDRRRRKKAGSLGGWRNVCCCVSSTLSNMGKLVPFYFLTAWRLKGNRRITWVCLLFAPLFFLIEFFFFLFIRFILFFFSSLTCFASSLFLFSPLVIVFCILELSSDAKTHSLKEYIFPLLYYYNTCTFGQSKRWRASKRRRKRAGRKNIPPLFFILFWFLKQGAEKSWAGLGWERVCWSWDARDDVCAAPPPVKERKPG